MSTSSPTRSPRKAVSAPPTSDTKSAKTSRIPKKDQANSSSTTPVRRGVAFGEVKVQSFARVQARDKVPDDGHSAALGLGAAVGAPITRRVSQFELLRDQKGRSPAKAFLKRKLSFNTRQQMLLSAVDADTDGAAAAADDESPDADQESTAVSPLRKQNLLRKRKSIIEYDREVRRIVDQRARASGCHCASGAACRTVKCLCFKDQLACLWDLCVCECKNCVNRFNSNDDNDAAADADDDDADDDNDEAARKKSPSSRNKPTTANKKKK